VLLRDSLDEVLRNKRAGCVNAIRDFVDRNDTLGITVYRSTKSYRIDTSSEARSYHNHSGRSRPMTTLSVSEVSAQESTYINPPLALSHNRVAVFLSGAPSWREYLSWEIWGASDFLLQYRTLH
jgi:hypothetical protein